MKKTDKIPKELKPLGYRVLIKVDPVVTSFGVIQLVENAAKERKGMDSGTIVDMGHLAFTIHGGAKKWGLKVGDRVAFPRYEGIMLRKEHLEGSLCDATLSNSDSASGYRVIEDELVYAKLPPLKEK